MPTTIDFGIFQIIDQNDNDTFDYSDRLYGFSAQPSGAQKLEKNDEYRRTEVPIEKYADPSLQKQCPDSGGLFLYRYAPWSCDVDAILDGNGIHLRSGVPLKESAYRFNFSMAEKFAVDGDLNFLKKSLASAKLYAGEIGVPWSDGDEASLLQLGVDTCLTVQEDEAEAAFKAGDRGKFKEAVGQLREAHRLAGLNFDEDYFRGMAQDLLDRGLKEADELAQKGKVDAMTVLLSGLRDFQGSQGLPWDEKRVGSMVKAANKKSSEIMLRLAKAEGHFCNAEGVEKAIKEAEENAKTAGISIPPQVILGIRQLLKDSICEVMPNVQRVGLGFYSPMIGWKKVEDNNRKILDPYATHQ